MFFAFVEHKNQPINICYEDSKSYVYCVTFLFEFLSNKLILLPSPVYFMLDMEKFKAFLKLGSLKDSLIASSMRKTNLVPKSIQKATYSYVYFNLIVNQY